MKKILYILTFLTTCIVHSQTAFQNHSGSTFQLHPGAEVGFHTDLVNEGVIEDTKNAGFSGFYSNNQTRKVSGTNRPEFHNVWIQTLNDNLELEVSLGVKNDLTFFEGRVITPRTQPNSISLDLLGHQSYIGADNDHYVDGYNSVISFNNEYTFPIGDDERLRPMILADAKNSYKGAYFFEDANATSYFGTSFDTENKANDLGKISKVEYWALIGVIPTEITLTWDMYSDVKELVSDIDNLTVVGWHSVQNKWINLGNSQVSGDLLTNGKIKSLPFLPNDYSIITLGSFKNSLNDFHITVLNTFTPGSGGANSTLTIEKYGYKDVSIGVFNRWGNTVYTSDNYQNGSNGWSGKPEGKVRAVIGKDEYVPTGTYFYVLNATLITTNEVETKQGWIYINTVNNK